MSTWQLATSIQCNCVNSTDIEILCNPVGLVRVSLAKLVDILWTLLLMFVGNFL